MESSNDSCVRNENVSASVAKRSHVSGSNTNGAPVTPTSGTATRMVMFQIVVYVIIAVLLVVSCLLDRRLGLGVSVVIPLILMIVAMGMWPLHSSFFDAVVGMAGAVVMIFGTESLLMRVLPRNDQAAGQRTAAEFASFDTIPTSVLMHICTVWAVALLVVLTVFVILGFLHQMLRRERTDMVLSLSHSLMFDVAMAGASGWVLSPLLLRYVGAGSLGAKRLWIVAIVAVIAVALLAGLSWASTRWWKDYAAAGMPLSPLYRGNRDRKRQSCVAIALAPVMYAGFVVFLALVALLVFVG